MTERRAMKTNNLVSEALSNGGKLVPLVIPSELPLGAGVMNPSVFVNSKDEILVNVRHINYTLYHAENNQRFISRWGPLAYLHPEQDMALRTTNYICKLDENLAMTGYGVVDTSKLDVTPLWEFTGEEDCRLVQWEDKYYVVGVRRDTTPNGQGRMELSEVEIDESSWTIKEVSRLRIPPPVDVHSYCEKNWMPILDMPYHFVKWTSPTEVVKTYPKLPPRCEQVIVSEGVKATKDQRGGSQVLRWNDHYIAITHEVDLYKNYLGQKDAVYRHRLAVWDDSFTLVGLSKRPISFLDAQVEFVAGAARYKDSLLISFGFQDNAAYILQTPSSVVDRLIEEAIEDELR